MELLLLCHVLVLVFGGWSCCYCVMFWFLCLSDEAVVIVSCFGSYVRWMELLLLCHVLVPVLDGWSCYCVMFWFQ